jgi:hypothetical protein
MLGSRIGVHDQPASLLAADWRQSEGGGAQPDLTSNDIWGADIRQDVGPGVPARDNDVDIVDGGTASDSCRVDSLDIVSNCEELPSYYF